MPRNSPLTVRFERFGKTFGQTMNEIRLWLDSHSIQPADFGRDDGDPRAIAFSIRFTREHEARQFEQAFT